MTRTTALRILATALATAFASAMACAPVPEETDLISVSGPSLADFGGATGVSAVLERNCASLDCHGNDARPLRIYGKNGLRKPVGLDTVYEPGPEGGSDAAVAAPEEEAPEPKLQPKTGGEPTTQEEVLANYQAVIALEPRVMQAVVKGGDPYSLLLLKKPLLIERHKGGPALHKNGDAETCIASWLKNKTNGAACAIASKLP
ncbi:MAG: hypothetical protein U0169_03540 [Polyangiaceae bacterium]